MRKLALIVLSAATVACAQYVPAPETQPREGVPKGTLTRSLTLPPGKYYPGTPHIYSTYVPAQYDPAKPCAYMVVMDGGTGGTTPTVLDNLIAKGEVPPLIGIFVNPGVLPAMSDAAQSRRERIFEYDNISDRFSKFLLEELIPEVGRKYNLSKNPDDHLLVGTSTGAVAAFVAAWHRPDQFHRVLSWIGTYVSMKGADAFPAMIRRTEPKPIRIFLQDGKNDHITADQPFGVFYGGSWPINNEVMYQALQFAGYDVRLEIGEAGHDGRQAAALMPDALRWLWRGYPQPIVVHEPAALDKPGWEPRGAVYSIVSAGKPWEKVGGTHQIVTSPTTDKDGNVYYADRTKIYKADASGKESVFRDNATGLTALRVGADSRVYAADPAKKRIVSYGPSDEKVMATGVSANDLALTAKNEIYFVDTAAKSIGYIDAAGKKRMMPVEIGKPSALSLTTDQALLLVGDAETRYSWSYQILKDGSIGNGEPFFRLDLPEAVPVSNVSGVTVDAINQAYFADAAGIQVCEQNGRCGALLAKPELSGDLTGIALTGVANDNFLYASEGGQLYRRPVKRGGVLVSSPVKPPNPPL